MSSTGAAATAVRPPNPPPPDASRAARALARFESARVLRHPAFLTAVVLYTALWAYETWGGGPRGRYPVLQDEDRYGQLPLLLLAAGSLVATNLTTTRMRRHGAQPISGVLSLPPWRRTLAHLATALPPAASAAALATARITVYAAAPTSVGSPSPAELATGPLVVLLAGCAGVTLACLTPSAAAGPYAVLVLGTLVLCGALDVRGMKWVGPVGVEGEFAAPLPAGLMYRPVVEHLVYLAAVTGVLALFALVRSGLRAAPVRAALVLLVVTAAVAGAAQYRPLPDEVAARRADAERHPGDRQRCRVADRVTFCAFPEFMARSADWQRVTDGILRSTPAAEGSYAVRQRVFFGTHAGGVTGVPPLADWARDDARHGTPGAVTVGTGWGTDDIGGAEILSFAVRFADRVVPGGSDHQTGSMLCGARAMTVLWLAAQATPETADALRSLDRRSIGGITLTTLGSAQALGVSDPEIRVVRELLTRPAAEIADRLTASWPILTDERTRTSRAARVLGAAPPPDSPRSAEGTRCEAL
ncbi:hypothetical protein ABZX85_41105 [Streptomyces sp. NPDC004539]|uniref:hypothetical protein n=1 Tax=Streptomyces sp. NPDC004539 TaxID=3154280 RepID=UPI0033A43A55